MNNNFAISKPFFIVIAHFSAFSRYCFEMFVIQQSDLLDDSIKSIVDKKLNNLCETNELYWCAVMECDGIFRIQNKKTFEESEKLESFTLIDSSVNSVINSANPDEAIQKFMLISYEVFGSSTYLLRRVSFVEQNDILPVQEDELKEYHAYRIINVEFKTVKKPFVINTRHNEKRK